MELPPSNRTRPGLIQGRADVAWSDECNGRNKEATAERSVHTVGFQEEHHDVVGVDPGCGEVLHKAFDEREKGGGEVQRFMRGVSRAVVGQLLHRMARAEGSLPEFS